MSHTRMSHYVDLLEFHKAVGLAAPETPSVPDAQTLELRRTLIGEEFAEVIAEFDKAQTAGQVLELSDLLHELADLLYVTYGTFVACGIDADAVFAEVHRANMQKAGGKRREDGKILKPEGFKSADVKSVLEGLMG
jgi:predicted HAD superfamily Cof-like phosphohydrolase